MSQEKKIIGRKKNPDKKKMIGIYHRPSEIEILGGMNEYKSIIYKAVEEELKNRTTNSNSNL
jgi:hypothetical protein